MPRKQDDVEKRLLRKGFLAGGGDHNFFFYHSKAGKKNHCSYQDQPWRQGH